jgi:hypothetical protein
VQGEKSIADGADVADQADPATHQIRLIRVIRNIRDAPPANREWCMFAAGVALKSGDVRHPGW